MSGIFLANCHHHCRPSTNWLLFPLMYSRCTLCCHAACMRSARTCLWLNFVRLFPNNSQFSHYLLFSKLFQHNRRRPMVHRVTIAPVTHSSCRRNAGIDLISILALPVFKQSDFCQHFHITYTSFNQPKPRHQLCVTRASVAIVTLWTRL